MQNDIHTIYSTRGIYHTIYGMNTADCSRPFSMQNLDMFTQKTQKNDKIVMF